MADAQIWKKRVKAWRASGKRSDEFCSGMGFSGGLLRHWAWRLGMTRRRRRSAGPPPDRVPLARVVKRMLDAPATGETKANARPGIRLLFSRARIDLAPGFDVADLHSVLDVLEQRVAARRAGR